MFTVVLWGTNGCRSEWGQATLRGKLDIQGRTARFLISYPALSDDAIRGRAFCRTSEYRLIDLLNEELLKQEKLAVLEMLSQIVGLVIQHALGCLNAEDMLGRVDLVVAVALGNAISVGSTGDVSACVWRRGSTLPISRERVLLADTGAIEGFDGTVVASEIGEDETFLAAAPDDFEWFTGDEHTNDRLGIDRQDSPESGMSRLARRWAGIQDGQPRLLLRFGITAEHTAEARTDGSQPASQKHAATRPSNATPKAMTSPVKIRDDQVATIRGRLDEIRDGVERVLAQRTSDQSAWQQLVGDFHRRAEADIDEHVMKPLIRQLILLYDRLSKSSPEETGRSMQVAGEELLDLLGTYGVEPYQSPDNRFDPKLQRCVRQQVTPSRRGDGMIAERVRDGFRQGERILRYEEVTVWRYEPPQPESLEEEKSWQ